MLTLLSQFCKRYNVLRIDLKGGEMRRSCLFLILIVIMSACSSTTQVKLVGLVQSSKTDDSDNPIDIFGKSAYPIDQSPSQEQLLEKVDSKIEADAELTESYSGKKTILIKKFRILKDAAE